MLCIIHGCSHIVPDPLLPFCVSVECTAGGTRSVTLTLDAQVCMGGQSHLSWPLNQEGDKNTCFQSDTFVILRIPDTLINSFECKQISSVT